MAELAKDPNTDLETLCELMRNDGSQAADIIRISNSPYYAPTTLHSNLSSAVNSIGLREVIPEIVFRSLVLWLHFEHDGDVKILC